MIKSLTKILCILLIVLCAGCGAKKNTDISKTTVPKKKALPEITEVNYLVKDIPDTAIDYLNNKLSKSSGSHKIVMYLNFSGFPYSSELETAIRNVEGRFSSYEFEAMQTGKQYDNREDLKADTTLRNLCNICCVINPQQKQIVVLKFQEPEEFSNLQSILTSLLDW